MRVRDINTKRVKMIISKFFKNYKRMKFEYSERPWKLRNEFEEEGSLILAVFQFN